jgi:hypothetical protein
MITASRWQESVRGRAAGGAVVLVVALATGCKSGTSSSMTPSWWSFGSSKADNAALASAPPAPTDVTKPSSTAKPYPTTTTPEGYVLESGKQSPGQVAVASAAVAERAPTEPVAVTYGSTPPAATAAATPATPATATSSLSSITPQVGPYGAAPQSSLGPDQPLPTPSSPAFAAAPPAAVPAAAAAVSAPPAAAPESRFGGAGTRVADARGADGWAAPPPAATPAAPGDSRYAGGGSRFSAIDAAAMTAPPAAATPAFGAAPATPAEFAPPPAAPPVTAAPPATLPPAPAAVPPSSPVVPSAPPGTPPTPTRRPDPGYRPGGTSSYRPSRTILAGDSGTDGGVRQVSFQADGG